jgi:AP-2 complex subunit beta-1
MFAIPYAPVYSSPYARSTQGKVAELRQELNSGGKKDKNYSAKKIALKKIVANMTMSNNDMVSLFPDVIGCMSLPSLEIKKMYVGGRLVMDAR